MSEEKTPLWKHLISIFTDAEWHPDLYKVGGIVGVAMFYNVVVKVLQMVDAKEDTTRISLVAALLVPITTMITFLLNFSKQNDAVLTNKAVQAFAAQNQIAAPTGPKEV
jgi:hypothetical protein